MNSSLITRLPYERPPVTKKPVETLPDCKLPVEPLPVVPDMAHELVQDFYP